MLTAGALYSHDPRLPFLATGSLVSVWEPPGSDAAVGDGQPAD